MLLVDTPSITGITDGAGFRVQPLASEQFVSVFGYNLAGTATSAPSLPLETLLAGTSVSITDGAGVSRAAQLVFVGPGQVNLVTPEGMAPGSGTLTITNVKGWQTTAPATIEPVSPGLFSANQNGRGVAAANVLRAGPGGAVSSSLAASCSGTGACTPNAIDVSSGQVFLSLYGTGLRGLSGLAGITVEVGGVPVEIQFAGLQPEYPGLDQVNVVLPAALAGRGDVDVVVTVDGKVANTVTVRIQ